MGISTSSMTFAQFELLPEEEVQLELLDGELVRMPPASNRHVRIAMRLVEALKRALQDMKQQGQATDLGEVLQEAGYRIEGNWLVPDVSISLAGQPEDKYFEGSPALAIEVISASNTAEMMRRKVRRYLDGGAIEVWLIYPDAASVSLCRGKASVELDQILTSDLLPGMTINLAELLANSGA